VTIVEKNKWFRDGVASIWCKISEIDQEDGILETIVEKLGCQKDADGSVVLTFASNCRRITLTRKFKVRAYGEQDVDVLFGRDPWKEEAERSSRLIGGDSATEMRQPSNSTAFL
jgi:hypothetical protein